MRLYQIPRLIGAMPIVCAALTTGFLYSPMAAATRGTPSIAGLTATDSAAIFPDEVSRRHLVEKSKVIFINGDEGDRASRDSVESMIMRFYANQFRNSQDPEAPYFTFMSKDANLAMGIGGVIKVRGYFDWAGMVDGGSFCTALIEPRSAATKRNLGSSVAGTTIFFTIMGRNTPLGTYQAYIEGGFNGYQNSGFKLKKAWFQWNDFTLGLATTTFSDPAAQPDCLMAQEPTAKLTAQMCCCAISAHFIITGASAARWSSHRRRYKPTTGLRKNATTMCRNSPHWASISGTGVRATSVWPGYCARWPM